MTHRRLHPIILFLLAGGAFCLALAAIRSTSSLQAESPPMPTTESAQSEKLAQATFGGGCFWCTEAVFLELRGVKKVASGYCGGRTENPTYEDVCSGLTGHAEVIQVQYDPAEVSFAQLLEVFFKTHDPTTLNQQGNDVGPQYRSVIFYHDAEQQRIAEIVKKDLDASGAYSKPIVTEISPFTAFFPAEDYHQNYFAQNESQPYCTYVIQPKLDKFRKVFAKQLKQAHQSATADKSADVGEADWENVDWKAKLTPEQYHVTCEFGTERPFANKYWNNKTAGTYKCVRCGLPLFTSQTKYDSGTGWPSFYQPVDSDRVREHEDHKLGMVRTEVRCSRCGAHLGHVFNDGPNPTGMRYCMNSAALDFLNQDAEETQAEESAEETAEK